MTYHHDKRFAIHPARIVVWFCILFFQQILSIAAPVPCQKIYSKAFSDSTPGRSEFGMRLRKVPPKVADIFEPVILKEGPTNEATMIKLSSGLIKIFFINRPGEANKMMSISSSDEGMTWTDPQTEFELPGEAYYANRVMQDQNGTLHCIFHLYGTGNKGYRGKHLDLWYTRQEAGKTWTSPKKIWEGYVGSLRSFFQLKNQRLLIPMSQADPQRANKPASNKTDYGLFEVICLYSDDHGISWKKTTDPIKIPVESTQVTRYGAVEPNAIELKNGKIWMLIRTNKGHLYQTFSNDAGTTWTEATPSVFISSDSPAETVRLSDGRILILWNADQRFDDKRSYANGGREILHAAISADEGNSWTGFREVLNSPANPVIKGDRGTAYPSAVETNRGKILLVSGQGEGGRAIVSFDPTWLDQQQTSDNFRNGLSEWTMYGTDSSSLLDNVHHQPALLIRYHPQHPASNTGAVWNFPMSASGEVRIQLIPAGNNTSISLAITDQFSIAADDEASAHAVIKSRIESDHLIQKNKMITLSCQWNSQTEKAYLWMDKKIIDTMPFSRKPLHGLNYLRIGVDGAGADGFYIKSIRSQNRGKKH